MAESDYGRLLSRLAKVLVVVAAVPMSVRATPIRADTTPVPFTIAEQARTAEEAQTAKLAWAEHLEVPTQVESSNGIKLQFIPPGDYMQGRPQRLRHVTLTRGFYMSATEVTHEQWYGVMPAPVVRNPRWRPTPEQIALRNSKPQSASWMQATEFCEKLTEIDRAAGRISAKQRYRLPTEAEWEYACRAGTTSKYYTGDDDEALERAAWTGRSVPGGLQPVGLKQPNAWGLFDMHGNVAEWCSDWMSIYDTTAVVDPAGPVDPPLIYGQKLRSVRGGFAGKPLIMWFFASYGRIGDPPNFNGPLYGTRLVLDVDE